MRKEKNQYLFVSTYKYMRDRCKNVQTVLTKCSSSGSSKETMEGVLGPLSKPNLLGSHLYFAQVR